MRFSLLVPAAAAALIAGAAQATPNPAAPAVSPTPPSAAPIVYCPQVIVPTACRGATSGGGGGTAVGHGRRVVTSTRYSRRASAGSAHRGGGESYAASSRRSGSGYGRYASSRYDVTVRTGRARVRGGDEGQYARVERNDYDVDNNRERDDDRGEGHVRHAGPGYHDTWSGWGGRYGTADRAPSRGYRYSEEGSDRVVEHRRVEGSGGGYRDGQTYSYAYRSPPQVSVYEHHDDRGEAHRSPPPGADRYDRYDRHDDGDRDDGHVRGRGHDVDDRDDDDDKGPGGDAGDHHRYAGGDDRDGPGHDGRDHDGHDHDGMGRGHDGAYAYHHSGHDGDHDGHGAGGHREVYVFQHDGYGRGGHGGDGYAYGGGYAGGGYASSSSSYSSSSSSSSHGYAAYGARFYSGGCQQCQTPLRGNGYYAFSQDEDGALTWQNREDDQ